MSHFVFRHKFSVRKFVLKIITAPIFVTPCTLRRGVGRLYLKLKVTLDSNKKREYAVTELCYA